MKIKIELEDQELDVVMNGLAAMPWRASNGVIQKIMMQAQAQTQPPQQPLPPLTAGAEDPDREADGTLKRID